MVHQKTLPLAPPTCDKRATIRLSKAASWPLDTQYSQSAPTLSSDQASLAVLPNWACKGTDVEGQQPSYANGISKAAAAATHVLAVPGTECFSLPVTYVTFGTLEVQLLLILARPICGTAIVLLECPLCIAM